MKQASCLEACNADYLLPDFISKPCSIQLESGNLHLQSEIDNLKSSTLALRSDNAALKSSLQSATVKADGLTEEAIKLRAERDRSKAECQRLQEEKVEQAHRMREREAVVASLEAVRQKMEQSQEDEKSECQTLRTKLASAHQDEIKLIDACRALEAIVLEKV